MRKCENCGANLDSGERCDCEHDREKLDRACRMIADAISTMRAADGLLRECGIVPCATLDYDYDIMDNRPYGGVKDSGIGKEGPEYAIRELTEEKTIIMNFD